MTHLGCMSCGAVYELMHIFATASEFVVDLEGLRCPRCLDLLHDVSPRPKPTEPDVPMPEAFRAFIESLAL